MWRIHHVFHVSLLEQDITKKERVEKVPKLDAGKKSEKYKVEAIWDSAVYANKSELGHLSGVYYLIAWKGYSKEKNIWEPLSAVQYLKKLINFFHKDLLEKPIATFPPIDSAPLMARPTIKLTAKTITKQKRGRSANSASKRAKNWAHTGFHNNQPLIHRGLDSSFFFASSLSSQTSFIRALVFLLKQSY